MCLAYKFVLQGRVLYYTSEKNVDGHLNGLELRPKRFHIHHATLLTKRIQEERTRTPGWLRGPPSCSLENTAKDLNPSMSSSRVLRIPNTLHFQESILCAGIWVGLGTPSSESCRCRCLQQTGTVRRMRSACICGSIAPIAWLMVRSLVFVGAVLQVTDNCPEVVPRLIRQ